MMASTSTPNGLRRIVATGAGLALVGLLVDLMLVPHYPREAGLVAFVALSAVWFGAVIGLLALAVGNDRLDEKQQAIRRTQLAS